MAGGIHPGMGRSWVALVSDRTPNEYGFDFASYEPKFKASVQEARMIATASIPQAMGNGSATAYPANDPAPTGRNETAQGQTLFIPHISAERFRVSGRFPDSRRGATIDGGRAFGRPDSNAVTPVASWSDDRW